MRSVGAFPFSGAPPEPKKRKSKQHQSNEAKGFRWFPSHHKCGGRGLRVSRVTAFSWTMASAPSWKPSPPVARCGSKRVRFFYLLSSRVVVDHSGFFQPLPVRYLRESPLCFGGVERLWEALFVVSQKWVPFPTALLNSGLQWHLFFLFPFFSWPH